MQFDLVSYCCRLLRQEYLSAFFSNGRFLILVIIFSSIGCTKLVKIDEPLNTITTPETFATAANANAAIAAIYEKMSFAPFANGATTLNAGMSADELAIFGTTSNFQTNTLISTSGEADGFWTAPYFNIYQANAVIEGVQGSTALSQSLKNQLTGEAKFLRAFCHFYLMNYFGDVPLVLTTSFATNSLLPRTPAVKVYEQIISDLKDAQKFLPTDFSASNGNRTRANAWAATALLSRAYLYKERWDSAELQATAILENKAVYDLEPDLNSVFLANSKEAILQILPDYNIAKSSFTTLEGVSFIPFDHISSPQFYLTGELMTAFEAGDLRRANWVDSTIYDDGSSATTYYYPYKYKVRTTSTPTSEYLMILRLAEQYLIRAEARVHQNKLEDAILDINVIRARANLPALPATLSQTEVLTAIARERRIELFAEFGHRWFDLKRTGQADAVLAPVKPQWKPTAVLYPIPFSELQTDPNLTQNPGYF